MTGNSSSNLPAWLDYFTLRFWRRLPALLRKLLLLRMLLKRAVWLRALLGGLLVAHMRLGSAWASDPIFTPFNPLIGVNVSYRSSPAFADIDGDGDLDAFLGEDQGNIFYFANTGGASNPAFTSAQTNPFGLADIGSLSSPALVDIDSDGDLDAFIGANSGNIIYFENTGNANSPAFAPAQTNPFGLADVGSVSSPALVDIDGDGDLDAFIGESLGNIIYFENTGNANSPAFAPAQTNPFGLLNIGSYSSPDLVDIDDDGDLDAFIGAGSSTIYFENTGNASSPTFSSAQFVPFGLTSVGGRSSPNLVDINDDGDLDAFIGADSGNIIYFENTGNANSPTFVSTQFNSFGLADVGVYSSSALVDIDDDNDLDAFIGNVYGQILYFANTGNVNSPAFASAQTNPFGLTDVMPLRIPALVDIDNDGDLDAFIGAAFGNILYFANTGNANSPAFAPAQTNPFGLAGVENRSRPYLVDIDADGDLDTFIGVDSGNIIYFENTGNANSPAFAPAQTNPFGLADIGSLSSPALVDIDSDSDLDAFIGESLGNIIYFENTGNANSPAFAPAQTNPFGLADVGSVSSPDLVDIDGDGDLDAFIGEVEGHTVYFNNNTSVSLALVKSTSSVLVMPGQVLTYTLVVTNHGAAHAINTVISDTLPTGLTFKGPVTLTPADAGTVGTLPTLVSGLTITAGQQITVTFPVTVNSGLVNGTLITNTATVTSSNVVTAATGVNVITVATPGLLLTKSASANLVAPGQVLTYTLAVFNNTTTAALDAAISDILPAGLTFKGPISLDPPGVGTTGAPPTLVSGLTISAGQRITVTFPVTVNSGVANGTVITNTATVTSTNVVIPATGTNAVTIAVPGLSLVKSASTNEVGPGQVLTYSLVVFNNAAANALDGVISDTLPAGLIFKGPVTLEPPGAGTVGTPPLLVSDLTVGAGQRITVTFPVTVNASLANGALITNTAAVTSSNVLTSVTGSHVVTVTIPGTDVRLPIILKSQ